MSTATDPAKPQPQAVRQFLLDWQQNLCARLELLEKKLFPEYEPARFVFDHWEREPATAEAASPDGNDSQTSFTAQKSPAKGSAAASHRAQGMAAHAAQSSNAEAASFTEQKNGTGSHASAPSGISGSGISAVLRGGRLWEQAGVNFSHVRGARLPAAASANRPHLAGRAFEAMGVSIVIHPQSPYVPTTHANIRLLTALDAADSDAAFAGLHHAATAGTTAAAPPVMAGSERRSNANPTASGGQQAAAPAAHAPFPAAAAKNASPSAHIASNSPAAQSTADNPSPAQNQPLWWFGGGFDLTPYYGFEEDAVHWHSAAKAACLPFGAGLYPRFKDWCDRYFYLPHREEPRGIGGLFFDDYTADGNFDAAFRFARSVADHLFLGYAPIVERHAHTPYGERERNWQLYRRGRYVEFNLVCDRGTLFGLQSRGRTESILMSLPPLVRWEYGYQPETGSPEAELLSHYLQARDWV